MSFFLCFLLRLVVGVVYAECHIYQVEEAVAVVRGEPERERCLQSYLNVVAVHIGAHAVCSRLSAVCRGDVCLAVDGEWKSVLKLQSERREDVGATLSRG